MGNVCDLLDYNANDPFGIGVWTSNLAYRKPKDNHANYSKDQYDNKQSNYSTGKIGYMQTRELVDSFEATGRFPRIRWSTRRLPTVSRRARSPK